ncbi:MAG: VOC family protein [Chloroflexi bacterium]|nr:VOC family protein [Chloroflexota bacterium]
MRVIGVTIAADNMKEMVRFYNAVFDAGLKETARIGEQQFYGGALAGLELVLCSNAIAGVNAEQNRQQFRFEVSEIEMVMETGLANHGVEINPVDDFIGVKVASMADPDGNTIEFFERKS